MTTVEDLARALVQLDTATGKSDLAAVNLLADRLDGCGFRCRVQAWDDDAGVRQANLVATAGPSVADGLMISGHLDTVPWEDQPGWTRDALAFEIGDERVYGRGTSDMKVFIAQAVASACALDLGRLTRPLVLAFTASEEIGCLGAARLAAELPSLLDGTPAPLFCWIGEPTSWEVQHAHKSIAVFDVVIHGHGGHSGQPELGANAIGAAGDVLRVLGDYQRELRTGPRTGAAADFPAAPYTTLNLGLVTGGSAPNMIAERCTIRVSTRALPDVDPLDAYREVGRRLAVLDARDPASPSRPVTVTLGEPLALPAMDTPRGSALEAALFATLGAATSSGALLAADGCRLQTIGVRSLICGPGDFAEAHQPNESIARRELARGADVVRAMVARLCGA